MNDRRVKKWEESDKKREREKKKKNYDDIEVVT